MKQKVRRRALLLLSSGVVVMVLGLVMAVAAAPAPPVDVIGPLYDNAATSCINCHEDTHSEWEQTLSLQITRSESLLPTVAIDMPTTAATQLCTGCHFTDTALTLSAQAFSIRLLDTQTRVRILRADLALIYRTNADWDADAYLNDKPAAQIKAERINTLLDFIEADGSWGFHHPAYTDEVLDEAEALVAELRG